MRYNSVYYKITRQDNLWFRYMNISMEKKEYLRNILEKLSPYRKLAKWFLALLKNTDDPSFIEGILLLIKEQIHKIKDTKKRQTLIKQIEKLKTIRAIENTSENKDIAEADKIITFLTDE